MAEQVCVQKEKTGMFNGQLSVYTNHTLIGFRIKINYKSAEAEKTVRSYGLVSVFRQIRKNKLKLAKCPASVIGMCLLALI